MKFYEIDLTQCMPFEVNGAFIDGFERFYKQLFELDEAGALARDYSRSCLGCSTLESCGFMTDAQIKTRIEEAGFAFYPLNSHDVNAAFLWAVNNIAKGTQDWISEFAKYAANSSDVVAEFITTGYPAFHYGIKVSGEISGSTNAGAIYTRIIEGLKALSTAHTVCDDVLIEEDGTTIGAYVPIVAEDVIRQRIGARFRATYDVWCGMYGDDAASKVSAAKAVHAFAVNRAGTYPLKQAADFVNGLPRWLSELPDMPSGTIPPYGSEDEAMVAARELASTGFKYTNCTAKARVLPTE